MSADLSIRSHLYRLYPTPAQADRLSQWVGTVRLVYNLALEQRQKYWRPGRQFNYATQGREVTELRQVEDWLSDVPRDCLDQALQDLDGAYLKWWKGRASGPTPRKRGMHDSMRFPKPAVLRFRRATKALAFLKLPKIGEIAVRFDGPLVGELRNVTVVRRAGQWFAACVTRGHLPKVTAQGAPIGIDRGVRVFAALSNGELIAPTNAGRRAGAALARAQRAMARKVKGSNNRHRARLRVARLHMRVANARKDFLHKLSTRLANNHSVIVLEDLRIGNMTRSMTGRGRRAKAGLNRSILDQGWGMFHRFLAYKLPERGGELVLVPAKDTSRTCAVCGAVDANSRSGARFLCVACGHEDDADLNAAINILRRRTPYMPVEGEPAWAPCEAGTGGRAA